MANTTKRAPAKRLKKRKHIRFASDTGTQAFILSNDDGEKLKTPLPALVVEESFKGCSLVVLKDAIFHEGAILNVKVGKLDPMLSEIRWVKTYDGKISYIGLVYRE
jgi:hypothetical protein